MDTVDVSVKLQGDGYVTSTVRGKKVSCTHGYLYAVERLAEKLFPGKKTTIVRIPCTQVGQLHSKWRIAAHRDGGDV